MAVSGGPVPRKIAEPASIPVPLKVRDMVSKGGIEIEC